MSQQGECLALDQVSALSRVTVTHLNGGQNILSRLAALGICIGTSIQILRNSGNGPLLLLVRGTNIALGRGAAAKILVVIDSQELLHICRIDT